MATANDIKIGLEQTEEFLKKIETTLDDKYQPIKDALDAAEDGLSKLGASSDAKSIEGVLESALGKYLGAADYVIGDKLNFNIPLITDFNDGGGLPTLKSDFNLSLSLANPTVFPSIAFKNVQLDLGSFFGDFLDPVVDTIDKIIKPFNAIFDVIEAPVPGFNEIGINVNFLDILGLVTSVNEVKVLSATIDAFDQVVKTVKQPNKNLQGLYIPLGEFTLDVNGKTANSLVAGKPSDLIAAKGISLPTGGFTFEALEDANNLFNLLVGEQSTNLIKFQLPGFNVKFNERKDFPPFPVFGIPVVPYIQVEGNLKSSGLTFGYDATGLGNNAPLSGFYVDGSKPLFEVDAKIKGGAEANVLVVKAGGEIFIKGKADFYLPKKNPKVRFSDLENLLTDFSFSAQGKVYAGASIFVEYVTYKPAKLAKGFVSLVTTGKAEEIYERKEQVIATVDLFNFGESSGGGGTQPIDPNLAFPQANGELILNIGTRASQRNVSQTEIDETFKVTPNVIISAFGYQQSFPSVTKIVADAGEGDDTISLVSTANDRSSVEVSVAAELRGGKGNDVLVGGSRNDILFGGEGEDLLDGRGGNDIISGDSENDRIYGGSGNDTLYGNQGNDLVDGGDNDDTLYGNENDDRLQGGKGNDTLYGGDNNDALFGGEGSDTLYGDDVNNLLIGGSDFLIGGEGDDYLDGGIGDDVLAGEEGRDTLLGNSGNDLLDGGEGDDILKGGEGDDTLFGGSRILSEPVLDASGRQVFDANKNPVFTEQQILDDPGEDILEGGQGNDILDGGAGNDQLYGGEDNDTLKGGEGNDNLFGEQGDDVLYGDAGEDILYGGEDNDELYGGSQKDLLFGEAGNDILQGGDDSDSLYGGTGNDTLYGDSDDSELFGNDRLFGEDGDDQLVGGTGADELSGDAGNDLLLGEAGNDFIDGGTEVDTVSYNNSPRGVVVNINESQSYSNTAYPSDIEPTFTIASGTALDGFGSTDTLRNLENIIGSAYDDILIGNALKNTLNGLNGNDLLIGNGGDDILDGGNGTDTVSYRRSVNSSNIGVSVDLSTGVGFDGIDGLDTLINIENLIGSQFADRLTGSNQANTILGGDGNDIIDGKEGNDRLFGENGQDEIFGGSGNDYLVGGTGADLLDGGEGNDTASYITSTAGILASLVTKTGAFADAQGDRFISIENLEGSEYDDFLYGDENDNILSGLGGNDTIRGEAGDDRLDGGTGDNILNGGDGNDTIVAADGKNTVYAELGNDSVLLGNGNNTVFAGSGNNSVVLGNGDNTVYAESGNDSIVVGNGNNTVFAGDGKNTITAGSGNDTIYGGADTDVIDAGAGNNTVFAYEGQNIVVTQDGNDIIYAGAGRDFISAGGGNDTIFAGDGNNWIAAGTGNNLIYSGSGQNLFILEAGAGFNTIKNFAIGKDRLGLTAGLQPEQLTIAQVNSDGFFGTQISIAGSGDVLARLEWTSADRLTASSFTPNLPLANNPLISLFG